MPKYQLTRKYNIQARVKGNPQYEMVEFCVLEADTKEEAEQELKEWATNYFINLKKEIEDKKSPDEKSQDDFTKNLDIPPSKIGMTEQEKKMRNEILNK